MTTWKRHVYQERVSRGFRVKWDHHGKAKVFLGWSRHVRRALQKRTAGMERAMRQWLHRTLTTTFHGWAGEVRRVRDMRDEAVRAQLLRRGANLHASGHARAWFDGAAARRRLRRRALARLSGLGKAWRGWRTLMDEKLRRETLEWLFGEGMEGLESLLQARTQVVVDAMHGERAAA